MCENRQSDIESQFQSERLWISQPKNAFPADRDRHRRIGPRKDPRKNSVQNTTMHIENPLCEVAFALLQAGDYDQAVGLADRSLRVFPREGRLWELRGIAQGCRLCAREALTSLERAATLVPLSTYGQIALAGCYVRINQLRSASGLSDFLSSQNELPACLLADLAQGFDLVGQPEWALEVCRETVRRLPDCHPALFALAHYLSLLEYPPEEILPVIRQAFALCPREVLYRVDLALLLARCGRQADGYRLLIEVDPKELLELHCPPRLYQLAEWFQQEGDELRSQACLRRIRQVEQTRTWPTSDKPIKCNTPVGR